ncbi:hypothetical protein [Capnocytophaga sp. G2]|uniref:hypothetical protein n=1 Tax=Capnocytophaga sp. G2 TaxID=3110695 RepID=UPI002B4907A9|nr:hypothetical protein [Capnocytophaga sp. G2]MEB3005212.1 hypothetical protein [Capnocytophaga sp. G2]
MSLLYIHFGKFSAILYLLATISLSQVGIYLFYFNKWVVFPNTVVMLLSVLFLPVCYLGYYKKYLVIYRVALWFILLSFSSMVFLRFEEVVAKQFEKGVISLLDRNTAISIGEPLLLGVLFIFFLIFGTIFDRIIKTKDK